MRQQLGDWQLAQVRVPFLVASWLILSSWKCANCVNINWSIELRINDQRPLTQTTTSHTMATAQRWCVFLAYCGEFSPKFIYIICCRRNEFEECKMFHTYHVQFKSIDDVLSVYVGQQTLATLTDKLKTLEWNSQFSQSRSSVSGGPPKILLAHGINVMRVLFVSIPLLTQPSGSIVCSGHRLHWPQAAPEAGSWPLTGWPGDKEWTLQHNTTMDESY